jgi:hypothetical protein
MEADMEKRARGLVGILEGAGPNCGLMIMQGAVVLRCPGASFKDSPKLTYDEADLKNAVELNLLEKRKMRADALAGSFEREYYVVREKSVK